MKKTVIKIGEVTIETDGTVDLEIDGNIVRVKGIQPSVVTIPVDRYVPMEPEYPKRYPGTGDHPWVPGPTWMSTTSGKS